MSNGSDSVRVVLRDRQKPDHFLVLSEVDDPDNFKLPGGKFETGETPVDATLRELAEEVGLQLNASDIGEPVELLNDDGVSKRYITNVNVDTEHVKPTDEIAKVLWVTEVTVPEGKNKNHILAAVHAGGSNE